MKSRALAPNGIANPPKDAQHTAEQARVHIQAWQVAALTGILLVAALLRFFRLDQQGFGNLFYAAGVQSMLQSWHNFFFVAFDRHGFLAIDKPPLGLWVQVLSVKLFGWSGWSLFLPQALAGTLSVGVLFALVRLSFGTQAGLLAALCFALTPIAVATDRNNTMDSLLVLVLLLAAMCVGKAAKSGKLPMLLCGAVLIGLGFTIKMMQAFLPLPAFCLWYLAASPRHWQQRTTHLALAGAVIALVSLPWVLAVDLTPVGNRPFVASSSNSELDLIIGHNGGARVMENPFHTSTPLTPYVTDEIGFPGPLRLWQQQLGGQASWLLLLALFGMCIGLWQPLRGGAASRATLLMWGAWLVLEILFFSVGRKFHRYYLVMLAPPVAALAGIGLAVFWQYYRQRGWRSWLLPGALLATAIGQVAILLQFADWGHTLAPLVAGATIIAIIALIVLRWRNAWSWASGAYAASVAALLLAPTLWAVTPVWGAQPSQPFAGPELWSQTNNAPRVENLVRYLHANQGGARFIAATIRANTAAPIMLESGEAVMTLGGYSGGDIILTPQQFASLVAAGDVRFVLLPDKTDEQPQLVGWVTTHCAVVSPTVWREPSDTTYSTDLDTLEEKHRLFDCN